MASFASSYIPTTTATATRAADVCSISGSNFSSWYRQDEGTVFAEARKSLAASNALMFSINDSSFLNRQAFLYPAATQLRYRSITGNVNDVAISYSVTGDQYDKACGSYKVNDFGFSVANLGISTDGSASVPLVSQLNLGTEFSGTSSLNGHIRRLTYWPQRLSNATLQAITL